ncbi:MAG: SUMF1/EgtB/PvdO family nonheme iron enzyme [Thermoguttaceae bacterium]
MKLKNLSAAFFAAVMVVLVVLASGIVAQADTITHPNASGVGSTTINMDFVNVDNAGNTADDTTCGAVGYNYRIGTYEVTAEQWAAVLAAAPGVGNAGYWSGSQPTAGTSWYEAAKFCNWLTTGDVNSGVYNTNTWAIMDHQTAGMTYGTAYFIPTEDEWYKAAYYDPAKAGGAGYWDYPTRSDTAPTATTVANQLGVAPGSANYAEVVGSPTNVGAYSLKPSTSAYGTFDQGGNVWEWNEALIGFSSSSRGLRGGSFDDFSDIFLAASTRWGYGHLDIDPGYPAYENNDIGFRVASVPEPGSITLLVCGAIAGLIWRRCRK